MVVMFNEFVLRDIGRDECLGSRSNRFNACYPFDRKRGRGGGGELLPLLEFESRLTSL